MGEGILCGIAGAFGFDKIQNPKGVVDGMIKALLHRGPDGSNIIVDHDAEVALAHSRLSIQDLTDFGLQPMVSSSSRYVISFNGEIYNFKKLRADLGRSVCFKGESDTEVLLGLIERDGIDAALQNVVGMFAFALWDRRESTLFLVRDRLGEKPLFYGMYNDAFIFASEMKAFYSLPGWKGVLAKNAIELFLQFGYVPSPYSIFSNVHKVSPGEVLEISLTKEGCSINKKRYWLPENSVSNRREQNKSEDQLLKSFDELLDTSIREKMISDVPIGAFLSGGIDSSLIVAKMQEFSSSPIKTFTIGFDEADYNEAQHAKKIADYLNTDHTEVILGEKDVLDVIPSLPCIYDEPFADSSQIPTYLVSKIARSSVTVALSGDGGDELFGGYNRYVWANKVEGLKQRFPELVLNIVSSMLMAVRPEMVNSLVRVGQRLTPQLLLPRSLGEKLQKFALLLSADGVIEAYLSFVSIGPIKNPIGPGMFGVFQELEELGGELGLDPVEVMMLLDQKSYLPDDILTKVDRAAMWNSLETRVPLLDHRILEFSWSVPLQFKIRDGKGKFLLRELLYRYVPKHMMERPKSGFGIPIDRWLRGPLLDWAEDLLQADELTEDVLPHSRVCFLWEAHKSRKLNVQHQLWCILMLKAWIREYRSIISR